MFDIPHFPLEVVRPSTVTYIYGPPQSGVTALCASIRGKRPLVFNPGQDLIERFASQGQEFDVLEGANGEVVFEELYNRLKGEKNDIAIIDHLGAAIPEGVKRLSIKGVNPGHEDRFLGFAIQFMRDVGFGKAKLVLADTVTQQRMVSNEKPVHHEVGIHLADYRIRVHKREVFTDKYVTAHIERSLTTPPGSFEFLLKDGRPSWAFAKLKAMTTTGKARQAGEWYYLPLMGDKPIQGKVDAIKHIEEHEDEYRDQ